MKRMGLVIATVSALCLGALGSSSAATVAVSTSSWLQPQSDAAHSNRNNTETTLTSATVENLQVQHSIGRLPDYSICGHGNPHVAVATSTRIYHFDGRRVIATDLATGQRQWRSADLGGTLGVEVTDIAVTGSRVIVQDSGNCLSQSDPGVDVIGLDIATGVQVWSARRGGYDRSMVVSGNTVVSDNDDISGEPTVLALNATTGAQLWARTGCSSSQLGPAGGLFASNDNIMTTCGALSFSRAGATNWTKPAGWAYLRADPSGTASPNIYATNPLGKITALSPTGSVVWTSKETGTVLAAGPSRLLVTCDSTSICALNRTTGARAWKSTRTTAPAGAILAGDVAYVTPGLNPLSASTGAPILAPDTDFLSPFDFLADGTLQVAGGRLIHITPRNIDVYGTTG